MSSRGLNGAGGVADGEGLAGPLSQLERMVFSIQEVYLQICV